MSVNKVMLIGRIGALYPSTGDSVYLNFSMATNRVWKDKSTGVSKKETDWHSLTAFSHAAKIIEDYVQVGDMLYVEGSLRTDKYTTKDGEEKEKTKIIVYQVTLLGNKNTQEREEPDADAGAGDDSDGIPF